jgi:hypothetical protein
VERLKNHNVIGTKWVFRNKQDQDGIAQGLDYGETYAPVARLEAIRILLAY